MSDVRSNEPTATGANPTPDLSRHPCFNEEARCSSARVHLPVAPRCNVQCKFCNRDFSCANESRPGVTARVLSPRQAVDTLRQAVAKMPNLAVVGIAGPGDPFANPEETLETLRLVRAEWPGMVLCVATNGLGLIPHIDRLAELKVSHVTITINAVDPEIGQHCYAWLRYGGRTHAGLQAADYLLTQQMGAILALKARGILVKINTIAIPRVNLDHIPAVARAVAAAGADVFNIIPLLPVKGTEFGEYPPPDAAAIAALRRETAPFITQMEHCSRCRSDAIGLLGEDTTLEQIREMQSMGSGRPAPAVERRPASKRVAVASMEGLLVNQHLGEATALAVYGIGTDGVGLLESRPTPPPGGGEQRWKSLAERFADCSVLLVNGIGPGPQKVLEEAGLEILVVEGLVQESLDWLAKGERPDHLLRQAAFSCGSSCAGTGTGCG